MVLRTAAERRTCGNTVQATRLKDDYYRHFNFRVVNWEISVQGRNKIGLAITDHTDRLRKGKIQVFLQARVLTFLSHYFILAQLSALMPKPQLLHSFAGVVEFPVHLPHTVHSSFLLPKP